MIDSIKFGTDGWRAIIAQDFTVNNVARVALATAKYLKANTQLPQSIVLGYDCRFGGLMFAETVCKVFVANGIKVYWANSISSTPMVSLGAVEFKAGLGIIITASHNPATYNGFKVKGSYGGPLFPSEIEKIENFIEDEAPYALLNTNLNADSSKALIQEVNLLDLYCNHVRREFDLGAINKSGLNAAYDAMYGAGQFPMRELFTEVNFLHSDWNPSFDGQAPEPIHKNLTELSQLIALSEGELQIGLATDGDADRIGLYDADGRFVDSHHIILLLIKYLVEYKKKKGKVLITFSVSPKVEKLCKLYNLPYEVTKIGFKYLCELMLSEETLIAGEESGGIAIQGHIPERDGIWIGLVIWEYMAKTGKSLTELINEVYEQVGSFYFDRVDMHVSDELKAKITAHCKANDYTSFGDLKVTKTETIDGFKFCFDNDEWVMLRASGTEPVLRVYAESANKERTDYILKTVVDLIKN